VQFHVNMGDNDTLGVSVGKHFDSKVVWLKCRVFINRKEKRVAFYTTIGRGQNAVNVIAG